MIGSEYATIFAALGVRVTLIDKRSRLLEFIDSEITDALVHQMRQNRMTLRLGEEVDRLELYEDALGEHVRHHLADVAAALTAVGVNTRVARHEYADRRRVAPLGPRRPRTRTGRSP